MTQPVNVFLDCLNEFLILFGGVCVVHSEVAETVVFLCGAEVDLQCLCVAYVKVAVRFRRESCVDLLAVYTTAFFEFLIYNLLNKILTVSHFVYLPKIKVSNKRNLFCEGILLFPEGS